MNCHSCGIPIGMQVGDQTITARGDYCNYCTDEQGKLFPKEFVQKGIAEWLASWGPKDKNIDFMKRAEYYLMAMPAWAE